MKSKRPFIKPPYSISGSDDYIMARHGKDEDQKRAIVAIVPIAGAIEDPQQRQLEQLDRKEFIQHACNCHDELLATLKEAHEAIRENTELLDEQDFELKWGSELWNKISDTILKSERKEQ